MGSRSSKLCGKDESTVTIKRKKPGAKIVRRGLPNRVYVYGQGTLVHTSCARRTIVAIQSDFSISNESNYNEVKMAALLNTRIVNTAIQRTATDAVQQLGYK